MESGFEKVAEHGVLCFGGEDWWYHNRGHADMQYMRQFAQCGRVVYINSIVMRKPNFSEGKMFFKRLARKFKSIRRGLVEVPDGFWVYSPLTAPVHHLPTARTLNDRFLRLQVRLTMRRVGLRTPLVWVNCPAACDTVLALPRLKLIYQRTDRYEDYPGVDREQVARYDRRLKENADLTFFCNQVLFDAEQGQCRKAIYADHGVDYEHFVRAADDPWVPPEMQNLKRPVAGFYGGIDAHTFDMKLMSEVVAQLPEVTFVFLGKASIDCTPLTQYQNVVRIDQKPYEQIPHYGKCFDIGLMPWNNNEWIRACNPIKLKEYLALGLPVVSTPFPQLAGYDDLVLTAGEARAFASHIAHAAARTDNAVSARRREFAREHSWKKQSLRIATA